MATCKTSAPYCHCERASLLMLAFSAVQPHKAASVAVDFCIWRQVGIRGKSFGGNPESHSFGRLFKMIFDALLSALVAGRLFGCSHGKHNAGTAWDRREGTEVRRTFCNTKNVDELFPQLSLHRIGRTELIMLRL